MSNRVAKYLEPVLHSLQGRLAFALVFDALRKLDEVEM